MNHVGRLVAAAVASLFWATAALAQSSTLTFYGTLAPAAGVSTTLNTASTTLGTNSGAIPGQFYWLTIVNTGTTNPLVVCWKGAACSASVGGETLAPGASDRVNLNGQTTAPTMFSTLGTTVAVHD